MTWQHQLFKQLNRLNHYCDQYFEIKSTAEILLIQKACAITVDIFQTIIHELDENRTELDIASKMKKLALAKGADDMAFTTIVACGNRTSLVHADASTNKLQRNSLIMFDFGVVVRGYHSDLTRTIFWGKQKKIEKKQFELYQLVATAQLEALKMIRAGVYVKDIDEHVRWLFSKHKLENCFPHSLGHGVGLRIHESPRISNKNMEAQLKAGMVITIEPGLYIPEKYGIRIEDTLVVTSTGYKNLTEGASKELFIA